MLRTTLAYIVEEGKVLMLHRNKRKDDVHYGKYVGPGGKLEGDEGFHQCMKREVLEETGLVVLKDKLVGTLFFPNFDGENDIFSYVYRVEKTQGQLSENHEGKPLWVDKEDVLKLPLWEGDKIFLPWILQDGPFFEGIFYYEKGVFQNYEVKFGGKMNPKMRLRLENGDEMILELYPEIAPKTVENFVHLVEKGFYDGLSFHRVIPGFMIQGGCPEGTGTGGPGYAIPGEFKSNGFENSLRHERGVLSMARSMMADSAGSQFFIMHKNSPHLDGEYAAFGRVVEGLAVLDRIAAVATGSQDKPLEPVVIDRIDLLEE